MPARAGSCSRMHRSKRSFALFRRSRPAGCTSILRSPTSSSAPTPARDLGLTARERDVLRLLADGHSNESIGRELFISPDTARTQLGAAMAKLGVSTRTQAVAMALRRSLIS